MLRLSEQLKAEAVGANALKRQLLQYSDIAERYKNTIKDGNIEPGMEEVLAKIGHLFSSQTNPTVSERSWPRVVWETASSERVLGSVGSRRCGKALPDQECGPHPSGLQGVG